MMLLSEVLKRKKKLLAFVRLRQNTEAGVLGEESQGACSRRQHINKAWPRRDKRPHHLNDLRGELDEGYTHAEA